MFSQKCQYSPIFERKLKYPGVRSTFEAAPMTSAGPIGFLAVTRHVHGTLPSAPTHLIIPGRSIGIVELVGENGPSRTELGPPGKAGLANVDPLLFSQPVY